MSEFLTNMHEAVEHIRAAGQIFARGPLDYYLRKLVSHSDALLTRFAPFKAGDRVEICKQVECRDGWAGRERTLRVGAPGRIVEVDYEDDRFVVRFVPDQEWYWHDGVEHLADRPHSYYLSADYFAGVRVLDTTE